jgi:hypothetical protein
MTHTAWEPERTQRIRQGWNDPFFRLFGELLAVLRNFTAIFDFSRRRMILETPR